MSAEPDFAAGRPVVLRGGTVLTMDGAHRVLENADVLVDGDRIAAVGPALEVPDGTVEIDAAGGIVMPGMIDTHRHMWQTAMRGYGADWTLTQYFVWYYLESGKHFRPQDLRAGNLLAAAECLDAGVTTCVDWSHGLQTVAHAEAAVDALRTIPGRFVLAYGNIQQGPWEWSTSPDFQAFARRQIDSADDRLAFQMAFDVTGDPTFPEKAAYEVARELGVPVTTHAGVWGATTDDSIRLAHEAGFMDETSVFVHAATLSTDSYQRIAATGGSVSVATESEQSAGQGYPTTWELRAHGIPVSLSMDTSVWWSGDLFSAMRSTLGADRSREHLEAHAKGETVTQLALRAEQVVEWATRGGAHAIGRDRRSGQPRGGQEGRHRVAAQRPLAGVVPAAEPVRPRRLPGSARRRAHGAGGRAGGQARAPPGRGGPAGHPRGDREHRRVPALDPGRGGLGQGHVPGQGQDRVGRQPVPVLRLPERGCPSQGLTGCSRWLRPGGRAGAGG